MNVQNIISPQHSNNLAQSFRHLTQMRFILPVANLLTWFHISPDTCLLCFPFIPRSTEKSICHLWTVSVSSFSRCKSFIISRPSLIRMLNCLGLITEPILSRKVLVHLSPFPSTPCFQQRFTMTIPPPSFLSHSPLETSSHTICTLLAPTVIHISSL